MLDGFGNTFHVYTLLHSGHTAHTWAIVVAFLVISVGPVVNYALWRAERDEPVEDLLLDSSKLMLGEGGSSEQSISSSKQRAHGSAPSHLARDRRQGRHPSMHLSLDRRRLKQAISQAEESAATAEDDKEKEMIKRASKLL
ncbi:hypothetical protein ACEPAH_3755 [Sanghuangporus vaninii]